MKAYGDTESVNLSTGERYVRVVGDGQSVLEKLGIAGLNPVDPDCLAEYEREMTEEGVPQILKDMAMRKRLSAEARQRIL